MTREAELLERPDAIPIQINFIPCDAMPGRNRMRMMIIMPAFAKGEDRDPPVVGGEIVGDKAARAPSVGDGVHHPGAVQAHYGADEGCGVWPPKKSDRLPAPELRTRSDNIPPTWAFCIRDG